MAVKKSGLGRGLDALISGGTRKPRSSNVKQEKTEVSRETSTDSGIIENQKMEEKDDSIKENDVDQGEKTLSKESETTIEKDEKIKQKKKNTVQKDEQTFEKKESATKKSEMNVPVSMVEPNRKQPRRHFDEDALLELAESIKQYGVLQPLLVSDQKTFYEIIAGERRWRAAKMAGIKEIPVIIREYSSQEILEISLIENIQREDLNPIEEAQAYKRLLDEFNLKQDEVAERISKSRTAVTNSVRLLKLAEEVQQMLIDEMISAGHARALLAITSKKEQVTLAMKIFDEKLSVRETEKLVKKLVNPSNTKEKTKTYTAEDAAFESLEEKMKGIFGTKVSIMRKKNHKGKIEIEYYSKNELERIIELLESVK